MVVCVAAEDASKTIEILEAAGENAAIIGQIEQSAAATPEVIIK
jgi:phosphoribosylaminoimidazole (AIR) synthetase